MSIPDAAQGARRLGSYVLRECIGVGAMGTVHRAWDEDLSREVAVKVLHPHLIEHHGFFKRFQREAEAGSRVDHPNVVSTFEAEFLMIDGQPQCFLVLEHVDGRTLRDLILDLGTVPEALVREIALQIASGLDAIHTAGVVHRDLKPENVMITDDQRVRIMDLGVARILDAAALTREGQFAGSFLYCAPEQIRCELVGPAADLYSLGVLLFELAAGRHPFGGEDIAGVLRAHLDERAPALTEVDPDVSPFLAEVVTTLLEKDPPRRFPSAMELAGVLSEGEASAWWRERREARERRTKSIPRVPVRRETQLYGRDADVALLRDLLARAWEGWGSTLLVEGEAGIGKSRLVDALLEGLAGEDARVLYGSFPPGGGGDALAAGLLAAFPGPDLEDRLRGYLRVTPSLVPSLAAWLRHEPPPEDAALLSGDVLHAALAHLMRGLAAERPLLWVVEDLHFASADAQRILLSLARTVEGQRVLLLLTTRPAPFLEEEGFSFARIETFRRTALGRLGARDVVLLVGDAFRSAYLAERLGARIALRSDGVPFFVFAMIRGLKDGKFVTQAPDGSWIESKVIDAIEVPPGVKELIALRLRGLSKEERAILDVGAVEGYEFGPRLVAAVLGRPLLTVLQDLAQMERGPGLVRAVGRRQRFDHHQIQEVLYADLPDLLREGYHQSLAEALEVRASETQCAPDALDGDLCVDICRHFLEGAQGERALRYLDAALNHLAKAYRNEESIALADRALGVPDLLAGVCRLDVLLMKNARLELLGRRAEQQALLAEARRLAEALGDKARLVEVERDTGLLCQRLGRAEEARGHHERTLAIAREMGDRQCERVVTGSLGGLCWSQGRYEEAREQFERQRAIAGEIGDRLGEASATVNLGCVFLSLGRAEEAREQFERSLAISREIGDRRSEAVIEGNLGGVFHDLGRYAEAQKKYERHLALAREVGHRQSEGSAAGSLGLLFLDLGRQVEARAQLERSFAIAREIGYVRHQGCALDALGSLAVEEGDTEAARGLHEQALALRREIAHGAGLTESLAKLGEFSWRAGNSEAAREALEEAATLARQQQRKHHVAWVLALLACLPGGEADAAIAAFEDAGESGNTPRIRHLLWKATGNRAHLAEAKRLLDFRVEHAPPECRSSMLANVRLSREILAAWKDDGGGM